MRRTRLQTFSKGQDESFCVKLTSSQISRTRWAPLSSTRRRSPAMLTMDCFTPAEGIWENGRWRGGDLGQLFPLPADVLSGREKDGLTYPVLMYDHDEGRSVSDGFAYHGRIAALRGKFVFGDIQNGRLFAADLAEMKKADDGIPQTVAPIEEIQLYVRDATGNRRNVSMQELVDRTMGATITRVDLHISRTGDGELLLTSRQDEMIRILVADPDASGYAAAR